MHSCQLISHPIFILCGIFSRFTSCELSLYFSDKDGPNARGLIDGLPIELHYIIVIGVAGLLVVLVALDMICYCSNDWGLLACICGSVGKQPLRDQADIISLDGGE